MPSYTICFTDSLHSQNKELVFNVLPAPDIPDFPSIIIDFVSTKFFSNKGYNAKILAVV